MSWTPATSIGLRAAHPSRMRILGEHRESPGLCRSHPGASDPVGKDSPRFAYFFSCRSTPLTPFFTVFAHRLRAERGDARAHSPERKWAHSPQFWCNVSLLDATLLSPLLCVASKGLAQYLSLVDATLTKNIGVTSFKPRVFSLLTFPVCSDVLPIYPRSLPSLDKECFITLLRSMSSALFLKTAECTGSLPVLELATRPSPLATSFASSTHSRGRPSNRRKLNHAVS